MTAGGRRSGLFIGRDTLNRDRAAVERGEIFYDRCFDEVMTCGDVQCAAAGVGECIQRALKSGTIIRNAVANRSKIGEIENGCAGRSSRLRFGGTL